jgi:hypothetical protein
MVVRDIFRRISIFIGLENPIAIVTLLAIASIVIMVLRNHIAIAAISLSIIVIAFALHFKEAIDVAKFIGSVVSLYTVIALAIQLAVAGYIDIETLAINFLKIISIAFLSLIIIKHIDVAEMMKKLYKVSPNLAIVFALSIKFIKSFAELWKTVNSIYRVNSGKGFTNKVKALILSVEAFISICIYIAIQSIESLITRLYKFYMNYISDTH